MSDMQTKQPSKLRQAAPPGVVAALLALLLGGCAGANGNDPSVTLDKAGVTRVAGTAEQSGEYATAAGIYGKYAEAHPNDAGMQAAYAGAALAAGATDQAEAGFRKAIALEPRRADAHRGLGQVDLVKKEPQKALEEFHAALATAPRDVRALNGAGIALDQLGRGREAQQSYRAALAIDPEDRAARSNLGLSLALSGQYSSAVAELQTVTLKPGATPRMRQNLALALGLKGDDAAAAKIEQTDLGPEAIAENQRFYAAIRRVMPQAQ